MSLFRRLFHRKEEPKPELPKLPKGEAQTQAKQDATRERMEAEVAAAREKRDAGGD